MARGAICSKKPIVSDSMNKPGACSRSWSTIGLLMLVNLIALSFFFSPGTGDVSIWGTWMREIGSYGLIGGFAHTGTDYPPFAFIILGAIVRSAEAFGTSQFLVLKCSLLVFLLVATGCFYWFARDIVLTAALEFSLILNGVALGYLDIYFAPFLIAAFFLLQRRHLNAGFLCYVISCAIKWQPIIIAPFICLYVLSAAKDCAVGSARIKAQLAPFGLAVLLVVIPILAFFGLPAVFDSFKRALTYHKFLSGYALNLPWIESWVLHLVNPEKYEPLLNGAIEAMIVRDPLIVWPNKILFYLNYAVILFAFARQTKTFQRLIVYSMLGYLAYFSFNTGVHENHLFLICCFAWILVFCEPGQLVRSINLSLAANANLFLFFGTFGQRLNPVIAGIDITLLFAVANLCLFAGFVIYTFRKDGVDLGFIKLPPRSAAAD
jgi:hypothetical protein